MSRGSAFVKFSSPDAATASVQAAATSSILVKDRRCKVDLAVDRDQAQKLKEKEKGFRDKRNIYLANEGLIIDGAAEMSAEDRDKRKRAQTEKRKKLQNPLFFVSAHRISIRNLAKDVLDGELKNLCMKALKAGLTKNLVDAKDVETQMLAQGVSAIERFANYIYINTLIYLHVNTYAYLYIYLALLFNYSLINIFFLFHLSIFHFLILFSPPLYLTNLNISFYK